MKKYVCLNLQVSGIWVKLILTNKLAEMHTLTYYFWMILICLIKSLSLHYSPVWKKMLQNCLFCSAMPLFIRFIKRYKCIFCLLINYLCFYTQNDGFSIVLLYSSKWTKKRRLLFLNLFVKVRQILHIFFLCQKLTWKSASSKSSNIILPYFLEVDWFFWLCLV
jgi:hypothetical protein